MAESPISLWFPAIHGTALSLFLRLLALCLLFLPAAGLTAEGPASDEPVVITDATGHSVALERLPEQIAIAGKATILVQNAVFLFEAAETRVIALENRRQSAFRFLPLIDPKISQKTVFAVNAGPEQIAATKPDLVLMKNFMAGSLGAPLKKLGIPVLYLNLETPDDFYRDIQTLGAVFGNPVRAETINQFYQTRINRVRELSSNINK